VRIDEEAEGGRRYRCWREEVVGIRCKRGCKDGELDWIVRFCWWCYVARLRLRVLWRLCVPVQTVLQAVLQQEHVTAIAT